MKHFIWVVISFVSGLFLGANFGFRFTQNMSAEAVEEVLNEAYSGMQANYSGSAAEALWDDFASRLKNNIDAKKIELKQEIKQGLWEKLWAAEG